MFKNGILPVFLATALTVAVPAQAQEFGRINASVSVSVKAQLTKNSKMTAERLFAAWKGIDEGNIAAEYALLYCQLRDSGKSVEESAQAIFNGIDRYVDEEVQDTPMVKREVDIVLTEVATASMTYAIKWGCDL